MEVTLDRTTLNLPLVCRPVQWEDRGPEASTLTNVSFNEMRTESAAAHTAYTTLIAAHRYTLEYVTLPKTTPDLQHQPQVSQGQYGTLLDRVRHLPLAAQSCILHPCSIKTLNHLSS